jgi:PAS domain-containing protein
MHEKKTYEQLENEYKELQFRVTRFSAVEQELINVRDQLDHELELYKRMHNYNGQALLAENEDDFYKSITDALVDVFELECGLVMIHDDHDQQRTKVVTEGIVISGLEEKFILETITLSSKFKTGKSVIVGQNHLSDFSAYKHLHTGLFSSVHEIKLGYSLFFGGFISTVNKDSYNPISERRLAMFAVFVQQMQAIFANRRRNDQLESQLKRIEKSERELKTLSLIATKSKNGVIITNTYGEIEWVNEAFSKISGKRTKTKGFFAKTRWS